LETWGTTEKSNVARVLPAGNRKVLRSRRLLGLGEKGEPSTYNMLVKPAAKA